MHHRHQTSSQGSPPFNFGPILSPKYISIYIYMYIHTKNYKIRAFRIIVYTFRCSTERLNYCNRHTYSLHTSKSKNRFQEGGNGEWWGPPTRLPHKLAPHLSWPSPYSNFVDLRSLKQGHHGFSRGQLTNFSIN